MGIHTLVHSVSQIALGPDGETISLKVFFKLLFASDLLSSDFLFLFLSHAHWPTVACQVGALGGRTAAEIPGNTVSVKGVLNCHSGQFNPIYSISDLGEEHGIQRYQVQVLALLGVPSIRREADIQMQ